MGTFANYSGKSIIPKDKREEFTKNVLKVLNYGGMMQFDQVSMYGKKITLIKPVELDEENEAHFHYNYFEDDSWESAGYRANDNSFYSNKIGTDEFDDVIAAIYSLYEIYDETVGLPSIDGDILTSTYYVGWLNQVLGTQFSLKNRFRIWEQYEAYCINRKNYHYKWPNEFEDAMELIPKRLRWAVGGVEFTDTCYLRYGTETLTESEIQEGSYAEAVYQCKVALQSYYGHSEEQYEQKNKQLWELICTDRAAREGTVGELQPLAILSLNMHARVFVYLSCELLGLNFWDEWLELKDKVYDDEIVPQYASADVAKERNDAIHKPISPIRTEDFLRADGPFTFFDTPKELMDKPRYYLSGDDRAFWWDGSDEVVFSEKMEKWLGKLGEWHKQKVYELEETMGEPEDMLKMMLEVLWEADDYYKRIFAFQNMFYEFLQNGKDVRYIAAIQLFKKLVDDNRKEGKYIADIRGWGTASRQVTFNIGRLRLKRFLAVMANVELRKKYFGF